MRNCKIPGTIFIKIIYFRYFRYFFLGDTVILVEIVSFIIEEYK
jgi:hypothetical protein